MPLLIIASYEIHVKLLFFNVVWWKLVRLSNDNNIIHTLFSYFL